MGRRNLPTDVFKHIDMSPVHPSTCWLWRGSVSDKGIPQFAIGGRKRAAYRVVYSLTHPEFDIDNHRLLIRHMCTDAHGKHVDNPLCCNPAHLEVGTHKQNMEDMMSRGRKGLTKDVLSDIIHLLTNAKDLTHSQIAKRVGDKHEIRIARSTVTDISNRRRRAFLRDKIDAESMAIDGTAHLLESDYDERN